MIIGFFGDMGSGKTLSMIRQAVEYSKRGYEIYANIRINSVKAHTYTVKDLLQWQSEGKEFNNALFLLDEAHIFLDSRSSAMKRSKILSYWLLQTRKSSISLCYTSQYYHQIDKRLRSVTQIVVECQSKIYNGEHIILNICNKLKSNGSTIVKYIKFYAKQYYKYYDTKEIVLDINEGYNE